MKVRQHVIYWFVKVVCIFLPSSLSIRLIDWCLHHPSLCE